MEEKSSLSSSSSSSLMEPTVAGRNDLGLREVVPESCSEEAVRSDVEKGPPLELVKTSTSRKSQQLTTTLSRVLSKVRTSDTIEVSPPPDGGWFAWTQALMGHLLIFTTWGFMNSFGVFQTYYVDVMKLGSDSAVSWIGTITVFILFTVGCLSGRALDAGYYKLAFVIGTIISMIGMFTLSICHEYWQVFLAQGIAVGFGFGLFFLPSLALVSTYFLKNRSIALGISVTGTATGGLVFPAIAEVCLPSLGFGWTIRIMGFLMLFCLTLCGIFLTPRIPPRKTGSLIEWRALKEPPFALYVSCGFFFFWSVYMGFFYVSSFARNVLGGSQSLGINLILVMNGVGIIGRLVVNFAAKYTGPINMLGPFIFATGVMAFGWIGVKSITSVWIFSTIYGITAAGLQGLWPVVLTSLTSDPKKAGARAGLGFAIAGVAVLTGPPIGGALIEVMGGDYLACQIFSGVCMMISVGLCYATRWAVLKQRGERWSWSAKV